MSQGKIFILSGPSGSGKTTLHKKLLLDQRVRTKLVKSISMTTRARRPGERRGRDYLFVTTAQFLQNVKKGCFLEWQKVFDNYYGTPRIGVQKLLNKGKNVLLCIDVKGAKVVLRQFPKVATIFITVPSVAVLRHRLRSRDTEGVKNLNLRLRIARREMREARKYKYVVVNDKINSSLRRLKSIVSAELRSN